MDIAEPPERPVNPTRRQVLTAVAGSAAAWGAHSASPMTEPGRARRVVGMVWQPSRRTLRPRGDWQRLGIHRTLVQWTAVDDLALVAQRHLPPLEAEMPDWARIAAEPWAHEVILGLAGLHDEAAARRAVPALVQQSRAMALAAAPLPLRVSGWYFPVEVDPTWTPALPLADEMAALPRPLWVSAHDSANRGPEPLADWIERWLPADVGVFFQDGVGVHARTPEVARQYLQVLTRRLGRARLQVIAEAFRPAPGGGFRSATADELLPQIDAYQGWPIFLFDGPHYLDQALVDALVARGVGPR